MVSPAADDFADDFEAEDAERGLASNPLVILAVIMVASILGLTLLILAFR